MAQKYLYPLLDTAGIFFVLSVYISQHSFATANTSLVVFFFALDLIHPWLVPLPEFSVLWILWFY